MSMNAAVQGMEARKNAIETDTGNIQKSPENGSFAGKEIFITMVGADGTGGVSTKTKIDFERRGGMENTGKPLDISLDGNGMFVVQKGDVVGFTITGSFGPNDKGQLEGDNGEILLGWPTKSDGTIDPAVVPNQFQLDDLQPLYVNKVAAIASATTEVEVGANLPATAEVGAPDATQATPINVYDSAGVKHVLNLGWVKTAPNTWTVTVTTDGGTATKGLTGNPYTLDIVFDGKGMPATFDGLAVADLPALTIVWDPAINRPDDSSIKLTLGSIGQPDGVIQIADQYSAARPKANGVPFGSYSGAFFDSDGFLNATFTNGKTTRIGKVPLANFASIQGLTLYSGSIALEMPASGPPVLGEAKKGGNGSIVPKNLRKSNGDDAKTLTSMITNSEGHGISTRAFIINRDIVRETKSIADR